MNFKFINYNIIYLKMSTLESIRDCDIEEFNLKGKKLNGKVVDIYDGDTCKIVVELDGKLVKFSCRLLAINAPEIKPLKNKENREQEKSDAKKCRNRLFELCTNCSLDDNKKIKDEIDNNRKLVIIECFDWDKYGRLLVSIYDLNSDKSFNSILLEENLAKPYLL
jgi:endonuclease YncB( thermonuclease family)